MRTELYVNLLARRSLQRDLDRISHAASRKDIDTLRAAALELKQMALCHGRTYAILTASQSPMAQIATSTLHCAVRVR